jgi:hypothetical protein
MNVLVEQFADEFKGAVHRVAVLVDPDAEVDWPQRARARAAFAIRPLLSDDPNEAAAAAAAIMTALWPYGDPDQVGRAQWWATPLGMAIARTLRSDRTMTYGQAAEILGVTRSTTQGYLQRGYLTTTSEGIEVESVLRYLARRHRPAVPPATEGDARRPQPHPNVAPTHGA